MNPLLGRVKSKHSAELERLLAECWDELELPNNGGMRADKLLGRTEDLEWEPPRITFVIERHGGMVNGSSRAELQGWSINMETASADFSTHGYRSEETIDVIRKVKPIAEEVADLILNNKMDDRIKWADDRVNVKPGIVLPKETWKAKTTNARKQFRKELERLLGDHGWTRIPRTSSYIQESQ